MLLLYEPSKGVGIAQIAQGLTSDRQAGAAEAPAVHQAGSALHLLLEPPLEPAQASAQAGLPGRKAGAGQ